MILEKTDKIVLIDKPKGITSFDVIRILRKKYNIWKTSDIIGSSEIKEDDEWLSLKQVLHLIQSLRTFK